MSLVTVLSVCGIVIGVGLLIPVLGVTSGFHVTLRDRILGLHPHLIVLKKSGDFQEYQKVAEEIRQADGVLGASPATYFEVLAAAENRRSGVALKGIDLTTVRQVSKLDPAIVEGGLNSLQSEPNYTLNEEKLTISHVVEDTGWLAVVVPDQDHAGKRGLIWVGDDTGVPEFGRARLRFVHAAAGEKPLQLRVKIVDDGQNRREIDNIRMDNFMESTETVDFGRVSSAISVDPGEIDLEWLVDGRVVGESKVTVREGEAVDLVRLNGSALKQMIAVPQERAVLAVSEQVPPQDNPRPGKVRLVNGTTIPVSLWITGEPLEAIPAVAAYTVSVFVDVPGQLPGILLGEGLKKRLNVGLGDRVDLVSPLRGVDSQMLGPFGMSPSSARFRVVGWFRSGYHEHDVRFALVDFRVAQRFLNRGDVVLWIDVRFDDVLKVKAYSEDLRRRIEPYGLGDFLDAAESLQASIDRIASGDVRGYAMQRPENAVDYLKNVTGILHLLRRQDTGFGYSERYKLVDWEEMNHNLFTAFKLQRVATTVFFLIIIVVAAFNAVGSQVMMIHEKKGDIAILKAMGVPKSAILRIFMIQGMFVSALGTSLGIGIGILLAKLVDWVDYPLEAEVYLISELPVWLDSIWLVVVCTLSLLLTAGTTLYSARWAARLAPVVGLRQID
ncbi:MAG: FtsX-like permease family protein [Myxococcales bacterium]|nr:FtsX-like permease family protein [Myxococcales bacterium]